MENKQKYNYNNSTTTRSTASKTFINMSFSNSINPSINNGKMSSNNISQKQSEKKVLSYIDFTHLRDINTYSFCLKEKRFKWQNLEDPSNIVNPLDNIKNKKKSIKQKENFQNGFKGFFSKKAVKKELESYKKWKKNKCFTRKE